MATTRSVRQLGSSFQNRLENLGADQHGDQIAAARASFLHQLARLSAPDGGFADQPTTADAVGKAVALTGGTLASPADDGSINLGIGTGGHHFSSIAGGESVGSLVSSAAALEAAGLNGVHVNFDKLQMGLGDIFVASQIFAAQASTTEGRLQAISDFELHSQFLTVERGFVTIDAAATDGNGAALLAALQALGLQGGAAYGASVSGLMPLDALDEMAGLDALKFARPAYVDFNTGSVLSQDVAALHGDYLQVGHGLTGTGLSIGIMSDSFNQATLRTNGSPLTIHYADDITSGDLPAGINIIADSNASSVRDEGRAMAQLIYDMAPGVTMSFATANGGQAAMANNILALSAAANVVVDDVRYLAEPMFSDGIVAKAVDTAVASGDMYFSSAGNYASASYESDFRSSGITITTTGFFTGQTNTWLLHDFNPGAGVDVGQSFTVGATAATFMMQWDQPFFSVNPGTGGAQSDLAMFIWYDDNSNGQLDAGEVFDLNNSGTNVGGDPVDSFSDSNDAGQLMIGVKVQGNVASTVLPGHVKYQTYTGTVNQLEWATNSGTAYGHANAAGAIAVAAADWFNTPSVGQPVLGEPFTSRGNVPIWLDANGNHLSAAIYRDKVEFTSADGGNTTFFSSDASSDADAFGNFYGTSAAAPNAAAIAILLKQAFPTATNAQIEQALKATALDIVNLATTFPSHTVGLNVGVGYDPLTGWGLIQGDKAYDYLAELMTNGNAVLTPGQAQIIGVSTEDTIPGGGASADSIDILLLAPLANGAVLYITDRNWTGTAFTNAAGEGTLTFTAGADLPAGTVIHISQAQLTSAGMSLSDGGETIYLYQGSTPDAGITFLHAVDIADGNTGFEGTELTNTGLVNGVSAVAINDDNAEFGTRTHNIQTGDLLASINDNTNWVHNDNSPQDGTAAGTPVFTAPDAQIWVAGSGAGEALVTINLDQTYSAGTLGYQIVQAFQTDANLFHPSDITLDTVEGKAFFVDADLNGHNRIIQINISDLLDNPGSAMPFTVLYSNASSGSTNSMRTLSVDTANNIIYFDIGTTFNKISYNTANQTPTQLANLGTGNFITQATIDYVHGQVLLGSSHVTSFFGSDVVDKNYVYTATGLTPSTGAGGLSFSHLVFNPDDDDSGGINHPPAPNFPPLTNEAWPVERGTIRGIDIDPVSQIAYIVTGTVIADTSAAGDGSQLTTYYGGVYSYDLNTTNNPNGDVTTLFTQDGTNGPVGLMYYIEVDHATGRFYVIDETGTNANPGDGAVYSGSLTVAGTPTFLATVGNFNGLGPQGLEIQHASTLAGTNLAATFTETPGNPSPNGTAVTLANAFDAHDVDSEGDPNADELAGAQVRISGNFQSGAGHADQLLMSSFTTGTSQNGTIFFANGAGAGDDSTITFSYNAATGVMTLTGIALLDNYENALGRLQFRSDGDNPTNYGNALTRTVSFSTFDGLLYSDEVNATVTVTGANDAPVNVVGGTTAATEDTAINVAGISVSDVDADPATQDITVTLTVTHGTLAVFTNVGGGVQAGDVAGNGTATVVITGTQNEINATLAAANGLTYTPTLDYNGNATLTVLTNDGGQNGTGGALSDSDVKQITIAAVNDAPVVSGDGTEDSLTIFEDQPSAVGQTVNALFAGQYSDEKDNQIPNGGASSPGAFSGIAVIANGSSGASGNWQYFSGGVWTNIGAASLSNAVLIGAGTAIRFNPAADYNGAEPQLSVRLIDNSLGFGITDGQVVNISAIGATGGTTAYSATSVILSGTVLPVNDAPTSTNLGGDAAVWTEGGSAALLDVGSNAVIADIDSLNFDTGTLRVHIGTGLVAAQDQLVITATGGVTFDATTVSVGGIQIATYTGGGAGGGDLLFTLDPDATPAAVQALVRAIAFDNSGGDNPTAGARNIVWTLVDGDGVLNGGADTLTVNSSVNVVAVNDAPSGLDHMQSMLEDGTYTFTAGDFGFSDVDGNNFSGVRFTTLPGAGTIFLDTDGAGGNPPVAISAGDIVALSEITAGHVTYVPAANGNGTGYASFTFQVRDDGGTLNGGVDLDQSPNTYTFDVTAVNDAPTSTNLNGDAAVWIEGSAPTLLDVGSNATIADIDSLDFTNGTLTVHIGTGLVAAQDQLGIQSTGAVTVNGANLESGGQVFATFTGGGAGGGDLIITFTSSGTPATAALVQDLVRGITFTNSGGISPTAGLRTITWTLNDGDGVTNGGVDTLTVNSSVDVQAINDAPTGADNTYVINEDATYSFTQTSFGFADVNNDGFAGVVVTTIPVPGTLFYDADGVGGAAAVAVTNGQFISASEIALGHLFYTPVANGNGVPFSSFTFQVRDTGGIGNGGQDTDQSANTITFNVTAVNDAPVNSVPGSQVINEDASFTLSSGNGNAISVSDVDATTLTVTLSVAHGTLTLASIAGLSFSGGSDGTADATMTFSGSAAQINAALGSGLTYNATANYNGADAISVQTTDGGQTGTGPIGTDSDSIAITVNSVNDAPAGTDNTVTGSEDDPYVFTLADFGFTDPNDSPANGFNAISVITFPGQGTLFLDVDGPGGAAPINLATVGSGVFVSAADIAAGHLYFQPVADAYGTNYASFTFKVQDDGGIGNGGVDLDPSANTITINVAPDDLPPVADLNGGGAGVNNSVSFTEDGAAVAIATGGTVIDQDLIPNGGSLVSMTVTLTDRVAGDSLAFSTPVPGGFSVVTTNSAGSIQVVISGTGTGAQYQAILNSIVYATTNQDPDVGGTDTQRTVTVVVNDGLLDSATATATVNIVAVDDAPVAQPDAFTITESGTITGGNLFANNGSGADSDPDGPPLTISAVNGSAGNVGNQILLGSGALLTVNANGTFDYDPNGAFDPTPTAGSGASNTPGHDGFTYTVAGGNTVNVNITLTGLDTDDLLLGTAGVDMLSAGAGNDTLVGGAGADIMIGGTGNDVYYVDNAGDQVVEAAGGGYDTVYAGTSYALAAGQEVEALSTIANFATTAIDLYGNEFANLLVGNAGTNLLYGGGGADVLLGLAGNDVYYVDNAGDQVIEGAGGGYDTVYASVSYALAAGQEVEALSTIANYATDAINLAGNELANMLVGNAGTNVLDGGAGADVLLGLAGNDVYYVDNAGDQVFEAVGGGYDTVYASTSYALVAGQEVEALSTIANYATDAINLTGNEFANALLGNAGTNVLDGGAGADTMYGFGGNDSYYVDNAGDVVFEGAGGGNDTVFASASYTLTAGQEIEFLAAANLSATTALNLTGNELANTIYGNDGANILDGKGGSDLLVGQGGADTFAFTTALGASNVDVVFGFVHGQDKIALDDAIFTAAGPLGGLNANAFVVGSAAADGSDRIIYNSLTGALYYDADGSGSGAAAIQFATLSPGLTLTASDFQVI
jgi:Ca2+-binding RTX toxin-like protein